MAAGAFLVKPGFNCGWLVAELAKPQHIERLGLRKLSHQPPVLSCEFSDKAQHGLSAPGVAAIMRNQAFYPNQPIDVGR